MGMGSSLRADWSRNSKNLGYENKKSDLMNTQMCLPSVNWGGTTICSPYDLTGALAPSGIFSIFMMTT